MSVAYWGDLFYGVNRIKNSEIFDKNKEKEMILEAMEHLHFNEEDKVNYIKGFYLNFESLDELDDENLIMSSMFFLKDKIEFYHMYCCNDDIVFFGIHAAFPWEIQAIKTQKEINIDIYNAIKPILKDNITFDQVEPLIKTININGADDYITYHEF